MTPKSNPVLLLVADLEEEMKKSQVRRVQVGSERLWSLAHADDLAILAKNEEGMKEMMKRMEKYLKRKRLQLNTDKSKMVCFKRGGVEGKRSS